MVDDDRLRARREARELLGEIAVLDPEAALDVRRHGVVGDTDKGGLSADTVGLLISAGSLIASAVQIWLARVPQRTIIATRSDGASLRISGREAREDAEKIARFLAGETPESGERSSKDDGAATN
ncbi:hypothetical protein [Actinoallomurus acaciae]|uniref:Uncharacterized protein n=1 Tax=Actinoallomurus acaciae TaxID=502577 RepID=A0ABV5Y7M1_9ACTN